MRPDTQAYQLFAPRDVLVRAACEEVGCVEQRRGWDTLLDEATDFGRQWAAWIRSGASGRSYRELAGQGVTVFRFDAGQRCFAEHQTRPQQFAVRTRGGLRVHAAAADWLEDLGEHLDDLSATIRKG